MFKWNTVTYHLRNLESDQSTPVQASRPWAVLVLPLTMPLHVGHFPTKAQWTFSESATLSVKPAAWTPVYGTAYVSLSP